MLSLIAAFACGRAQDGRGEEPLARPLPAEASAPLELRLEAPSQVRSGELVPLRLVLYNRGDQPVEVPMRGDPIAFDLVVIASDGSEVWRRLEGVAVEDILQFITVAPSGAIDFTDSWDQRSNDGARVSSGGYRIRGILPVVDTPGGWGADDHTLTISP